MRNIIKLSLLLLLSLFYKNLFSQSEIKYGAESFGSYSSGDYTPFWIISNTNGKVPLKSNNAYLRGNVFYSNILNNDISVEAGVDFVGASKHSSDFWIHQLFASVSYKKFQLTIGSKEYYNDFIDKELSQGDMCFSPNARPRPEILFGTPEYVVIPYTKGFLQFKADFAVGKSLEDDYVMRIKNATTSYTQGVLYHHKSLFLRWEKPEKTPFAFTFGIVHAAQWGGSIFTVSKGELVEVKQPSSFSDFIRIFASCAGGENATQSDQINVLGNHLGTMNARLDFKKSDFEISAYKQHFYDDKSGVEQANWRDGIWGTELRLPHYSYIEKVTFEFLNTTHQSGPFHFLNYDDRAQYRGGGADSYYNNAYSGGWSYFGRALGNPLLTSPEYNSGGVLGFLNNRIKSHHLGVKGKILPALSYRVLLTEMQSWGLTGKPFLRKKHNFSSLFEFHYAPAEWKGWTVGIQAATDNGTMYGKAYGCSLTVGKRGIIGL
jgi:hypothetical protein